MRLPALQLAPIASLVLALSTTGCLCANVQDEVSTEQYDEVFTDEALAELQMGSMTDAERCEAACQQLAMGDETGTGGQGDYDKLLSCEAVGGDDALPTWDPAQTQVTVVCEVEYRSLGFCTGRRPLGHRELAFVGCSRGAWFAEQAYLERASIGAFVELADWLERRGAPSDLVERCREAAADEVVHGDRMAALAEREGFEVPPPRAEPGGDELLAIALHNAVEGCVRESFGALLGAHQARACEDAELRELFARIADDELRHGQLAWDLDAWLLEQLDERERVQVESARIDALAELSRLTWRNAERTPSGLGWPSPELAASMAERFADSVRGARSIAA
jgi:hypothetical protein